jgi:hypothetical protein
MVTFFVVIGVLWLIARAFENWLARRCANEPAPAPMPKIELRLEPKRRPPNRGLMILAGLLIAAALPVALGFAAGFGPVFMDPVGPMPSEVSPAAQQSEAAQIFEQLAPATDSAGHILSAPKQEDAAPDLASQFLTKLPPANEAPKQEDLTTALQELAKLPPDPLAH